MAKTSCPECGCPLNGETTCPDCGKVLRNEGAENASTNSNIDILLPCPYCGHMVCSNAPTCPQCGGRLEHIKISCGTLSIHAPNRIDAPLYINGQLMEQLTDDSTTPSIHLTHPTVTVKLGLLHHTYTLNPDRDHTLEVKWGGFVMYEDGIEVSNDTINWWIMLLCVMVAPWAILIGLVYRVNKPIRAKQMITMSAIVMAALLITIPLEFIAAKGCPILFFVLDSLMYLFDKIF